MLRELYLMFPGFVSWTCSHIAPIIQPSLPELGVRSGAEERAGRGDEGDRAAALIHPDGVPQLPASGEDHGLHPGGHGRHAG